MGGVTRLVSIRDLAQVIHTLIKVEEGSIYVVHLLLVLLFVPLFHFLNLLSTAVLFLDVRNVGIRVFFYLYHVHGVKNFGGVDNTTIALTLLQPFVDEVHFGVSVFHLGHLDSIFGPMSTIASTVDVCGGDSLPRALPRAANLSAPPRHLPLTLEVLIAVIASPAALVVVRIEVLAFRVTSSSEVDLSITLALNEVVFPRNVVPFTVVSLTAKFPSLVETLHALNTRLRPSVLVFESRNLIAHRVQLFQLVLKTLLLGLELLVLLFFLFFGLLLLHLHEGLRATSVTSSVATWARLLPTKLINRRHHLVVVIDDEADALGHLRSMVPVLTRAGDHRIHPTVLKRLITLSI